MILVSTCVNSGSWGLLVIATRVSPCLRGVPGPATASADHCLTLARDVLEPGIFLSYRGERVKPALDFQVFTEAWAVEVFNVVVADPELGPSGGGRAPGQGFPTSFRRMFHPGACHTMPRDEH